MNDNFGNNTTDIFHKNEKVIGSGTYGIVYKGVHNQTKEQIAIKKIKIEMENEGIPSTALREISILRDLHHVNIIQLKDVIWSQGKLFLLFECLHTDLNCYIESLPNEKFLPQEEIKSLMFQLLSGLAYIHSKKVIHRDLKPHNLLLDKQGGLKIADFGLARTFSIPNRPYTKEVSKNIKK